VTEHCTSCGQPTLTFTERGFSCSACGDEYVAPYFLRAVISKWNRATAEMEAKLAKKEAKRAEKQGVQIAPAVAAYFTDDPAVVGEYKCEKCHKAPRRHPDFANKWKWKTAKGFEGHKCLG